jgi:hypothetical protein
MAKGRLSSAFRKFAEKGGFSAIVGVLSMGAGFALMATGFGIPLATGPIVAGVACIGYGSNLNSKYKASAPKL